MHGKAYGLDAQAVVSCGCRTSQRRQEHKRHHGNKSGTSNVPASMYEAQVDV
jgi:hypothetical protein